MSDWTRFNVSLTGADFDESLDLAVTEGRAGRVVDAAWTARSWRAFEEAVDAAVTNEPYCSEYLNDLKDYSNHKICGASKEDPVAFKIEVKFWVEHQSKYTFDFNVDFGMGGVVTFDGVRSDEGFHSGDHWWNGKLDKALPLDITHDFSPGMHTMVVYGAEKCCDGSSNVRFKKGDSAFDYVTLDALTFVKADNYAAIKDAFAGQ